MSGQTQNQRLAEWLQLLGCPIPLTPDELHQLNTPSMLSAWRHLQSHVMPLQNVQIIRRNLLLSKLKKENILPGTFGNFKIESIHNLSQLQNISDAQDEINILKQQVKTVDESLQSVTCALLAKVTNKISMKQSIKEIEDKTNLLKQKLSYIQNDIDKLDSELYKASYLKICHSPVLYSELEHNKSVVAEFIMQHKFSSIDTIDDDYLNEVIESIFEFSANTIFQGVIFASNKALRSLNHCVANLDVPINIPRPGEKLAISGILTLSKHLSNFKSLIVQNELDIHNCLNKIREQSAALGSEKINLVKVIEERCNNNSFRYDNDVSVVKFVDMFVENTVLLRKVETLKDFRGELELEFSNFEYLKWAIDSLGEKENALATELEKKVSDINTLITFICNSSVNTVKTEVFHNCTDQASNFFSELKLKDKDSVSLFLDSDNLIGKEIEMFQRLPLIAILRKWEESHELFSNDFIKDVCECPSWLYFLFQSEPKNILKRVLEKIWWSQTIEYL